MAIFVLTPALSFRHWLHFTRLSLPLGFLLQELDDTAAFRPSPICIIVTQSALSFPQESKQSYADETAKMVDTSRGQYEVKRGTVRCEGLHTPKYKVLKSRAKCTQGATQMRWPTSKLKLMLQKGCVPMSRPNHSQLSRFIQKRHMTIIAGLLALSHLRVRRT